MVKRYLVTLLLVLGAGAVVANFYSIFTQNPWTRDGRVSAYIVSITPRVTGQVTAIHISDNSRVTKGDLLFEIDDSLYQAAYHKAIASQEQAQAALDKALNEEKRALALQSRTPGSVATLTLNNLNNAVDSARANLNLTKAMVEEAKLNLDYTKVYASTDGFISNFHLRVGSQVVANSPVVALIDANSFWVEGYFKETDLEGVDPTDKAFVTLLIDPDQPLEAEVTSIGYGIAKQDGITGNELLPNVNPNFQWIRLAQRIPVKVTLKKMPNNVQLRVGMTASIKIIKH
ncbi:HlyD family secretion protein [Vibrio vulnificus]|uniref:HlyD family secretion protein n=1 Tax=Vibrio vulnificus TaxID=672 RepID=UPI0001F5C343|nr:HlyD family secretion protein [Vibrio vulnificus]ADV89287.1 fusaric acid resistance protein fusE [Vibrio vulnificus MO6-24/O]EGR0039358.1 HlyD family secretion protein [Vibrio vulnificus]EGR0093113.1 HlyD family secretion protein [Vibrio vulnificus]EGR0096890.1 HlyD family secretion protein [Vibrio vulnificus]EGR7941778.1 HlyD family secretion protein [Vibrio vulnificus]